MIGLAIADPVHAYLEGEGMERAGEWAAEVKAGPAESRAGGDSTVRVCREHMHTQWLERRARVERAREVHEVRQ